LLRCRRSGDPADHQRDPEAHCQDPSSHEAAMIALAMG
jgi:hypothetical protein